MSVFASICVIAYTVIGFFMHLAMQNEYYKDRSGDLDEFNPVFIQMSLITTAMLWPILIGVAIYQIMKGLK